MRILSIVLLFASVSASVANANYDDSWYLMDGFLPSEYPLGVAVKKDGAVVMGRTDTDPALSRTVECALPKNAFFHVWNPQRNTTIRQRTYEKIKAYTVSEDFEFQPDTTVSAKLAVKKGETVYLLMYLSEGFARVRLRGTEYVVSLFDFYPHFEGESGTTINVNAQVDQWMSVPCSNGGTAWLLLSELPEGSDTGVEASGEGIRDYGNSSDLQEKPQS